MGESALGIALLRPWIRKVEIDPLDRIWRDQRLDIRGIGSDQADIGKRGLLDLFPGQDQ